jgi:hypothetical protein
MTVGTKVPMEIDWRISLNLRGFHRIVVNLTDIWEILPDPEPISLDLSQRP